MDTAATQSSLEETESPDVITLSEEQLRVSLPVRISGRVRLIKYVETETVTQTIEVRREKLRLEETSEDFEKGPTDNHPRSQAAPADASAYSWQPQDFDLILHEEQVEMITTVVAVEKVHVRTRILTTDQPVSAELGRQQIELSTTATGPEARPEPTPT